MKNTNIYIVGDSTAAAFSDKYYYPRYGWGTQLSAFLRPEVRVYDLALSGRSSKSFRTEENYRVLERELSEGDVLIIGFGHNDEKSDDPARFTDARLSLGEDDAFATSLYDGYIKLARERGATPVLCTPIVRANDSNDWSGVSGHNTPSGDYRSAIISLGAAVSVPVIDLCDITRKRYEALGYEEALKYHAVIAGKYSENGENIVPDMRTVDTTHLNIYGAMSVAFDIASALAGIDATRDLVPEEIVAPSELVLVPDPDYRVPRYSTPRLENYAPSENFSTDTESGWYGTAFGSIGDDPQDEKTGYIARQIGKTSFRVGQRAGTSKGKIAREGDGFAFAFRRMRADENFTLSARCVVEVTGATKQSAFGLMLRDDCVVDQRADGSESANYLTAAMLFCGDDMSCNFYREGGLLKTDGGVMPLSADGDAYLMKIERVGQSVTVDLIRGADEMSRTYVDFDLVAVDTEYMYIGMFACRGTVVRFEDVELCVTGKSQVA